MRWRVVDSLYNPEARWCGHLDSWAHYLGEAGEEVAGDVLGAPASMTDPDVLFVHDGYEHLASTPARFRIAQQNSIAATKQAWECGYDLVLSAIPALVTRARECGARAELMPLAFDARARVAGMGVTRDLGCVWLGSVMPFVHRRRAEMLEALRDVVTVLPAAFGRAYFASLARARVVLNVHAEWAFGAAGNMRCYEAAGMGCQLVTDGVPVTGTLGGALFFRDATEARVRIEEAMVRVDDRSLQADVLCRHTYEARVPVLIDMVKELMR